LSLNRQKESSRLILKQHGSHIQAITQIQIFPQASVFLPVSGGQRSLNKGQLTRNSNTLQAQSRRREKHHLYVEAYTGAGKAWTNIPAARAAELREIYMEFDEAFYIALEACNPVNTMRHQEAQAATASVWQNEKGITRAWSEYKSAVIP
jgi:hypothetical protein